MLHLFFFLAIYEPKVIVFFPAVITIFEELYVLPCLKLKYAARRVENEISTKHFSSLSYTESRNVSRFTNTAERIVEMERAKAGSR